MDICNFVYFPGNEVCSDVMTFDYIDDYIRNLTVENGCSGNLNGISKLIETKPAEEIVRLFSGIKCEGRDSCPNQLALAIRACVEEASSGGKR